MTLFILGFVQFTVGWAAISAPTSCEITQSSFTATNPTQTTVSVTSNDQRLTFSLQAEFQATCTSSTGETSWASATGVRSYYVQGIDSTNSKTGDVFYGVEVKDEQDNNAFKYGARWTDSPCVSEQFKGTWTAGTVVCDSTSGSVSGSDCIDLFNAVEASICWQVADPKVCTANKAVSGTLSAYASLKLVAADKTVSSTPSTVLDLTSSYACSGEEYTVTASDSSASAVSVASTIHAVCVIASFILNLF